MTDARRALALAVMAATLMAAGPHASAQLSEDLERRLDPDLTAVARFYDQPSSHMGTWSPDPFSPWSAEAPSAVLVPEPARTDSERLTGLAAEYRSSRLRFHDDGTMMIGGEDPVTPVTDLPPTELGDPPSALPPWQSPTMDWSDPAQARLARLYAIVRFGTGRVEGQHVVAYTRACAGTIVRDPSPSRPPQALAILTAAHCLFAAEDGGQYRPTVNTMYVAAQPAHRVLQRMPSTYLMENAHVDPGFLGCLFPAEGDRGIWDDCISAGHLDLALIPLVLPPSASGWPAWRVPSPGSARTLDQIRAFGIGRAVGTSIQLQSGRFELGTTADHMLGPAPLGWSPLGTSITWGDSGGAAIGFDVDDEMAASPPVIEYLVIGEKSVADHGDGNVFESLARADWPSLVPLRQCMTSNAEIELDGSTP